MRSASALLSCSRMRWRHQRASSSSRALRPDRAGRGWADPPRRIWHRAQGERGCAVPVPWVGCQHLNALQGVLHDWTGRHVDRKDLPPFGVSRGRCDRGTNSSLESEQQSLSRDAFAPHGTVRGTRRCSRPQRRVCPCWRARPRSWSVSRGGVANLKTIERALMRAPPRGCWCWRHLTRTVAGTSPAGGRLRARNVKRRSRVRPYVTRELCKCSASAGLTVITLFQSDWKIKRTGCSRYCACSTPDRCRKKHTDPQKPCRPFMHTQTALLICNCCGLFRVD